MGSAPVAPRQMVWVEKEGAEVGLNIIIRFFISIILLGSPPVAHRQMVWVVKESLEVGVILFIGSAPVVKAVYSLHPGRWSDWQSTEMDSKGMRRVGSSRAPCAGMLRWWAAAEGRQRA